MEIVLDFVKIYHIVASINASINSKKPFCQKVTEHKHQKSPL
jgi:hypothetical protein